MTRHPLRNPAVAMAPTLLAVLSLLLSLPRATAQNPTPITLAPGDEPLTREVTALELRNSAVFAVTASADAQLLAEWIPSPVGESRPDSVDREQGPPDIVLSAVAGAPTQVVFTTGKLTDHDTSEAMSSYKCGQYDPCFKTSASITADTRAFFSKDGRPYVHRAQVRAGDVVHLTVLNYNRARHADRDKKISLRPRAAGALRITLAAPGAALCAGYDAPERPLCGGHGTCSGTRCECEAGYAGRLCRTRVHDLRNDSDLPPRPTPGADGWLAEEVEDGHTVAVDPFGVAAFKWTQDEGESKVVIRGVLLAGYSPKVTGNEHRSDTRIVVYWNPRDGEEDNTYVFDGPKKAELPYMTVTCTGFVLNVVSFACVPSAALKNGDSLRLMLYGEASGAIENPPQRAVFSFSIQRCDGEGAKKCPRPRQYSSLFMIPYAVLPICIAVIGITALAIIIMLWLDRRHGFTSSVDRLSQKELDRMYPASKFRRRAGVGANRADNQGAETDECLICLCKFEHSELVRTLHCEHMYHSECLDPWLIHNNASCPACRADVRIQHLSDRRRLRRVVTFFLWPIVWVRRQRARRSGDNVSDEAQPAPIRRQRDVEAGQLARDVAVNEESRAQMHQERTQEQERAVRNQQARSGDGVPDEARAAHVRSQGDVEAGQPP